MSNNTDKRRQQTKKAVDLIETFVGTPLSVVGLGLTAYFAAMIVMNDMSVQEGVMKGVQNIQNVLT